MGEAEAGSVAAAVARGSRRARARGPAAPTSHVVKRHDNLPAPEGENATLSLQLFSRAGSCRPAHIVAPTLRHEDTGGERTRLGNPPRRMAGGGRTPHAGAPAVTAAAAVSTLAEPVAQDVGGGGGRGWTGDAGAPGGEPGRNQVATPSRRTASRIARARDRWAGMLAATKQ